MMQEFDIAVIVSTFKRPRHLARSLHSLLLQRGVAGSMEVIVADDGSDDDTEEVVKRFSRRAPFPVQFITQPHQGFRLARSRNRGALASRAPYLLYTDGDCVFPSNHVLEHLRARRPGVVRVAGAYGLDPSTSEQVDEQVLQRGVEHLPIAAAERRRVRRMLWKALLYQLIRHPTKPKVIGNNFAIWREDLVRVNGFDERFEGWGCEDDDLRLRLRAAGISIKTILHRTCTYHLWHPAVPSRPVHWREGHNVARLTRNWRLTRCMSGLVRRTAGDLTVRVVGNTRQAGIVRDSLDPLQMVDRSDVRVDLELLVFPGGRQFTGRADSRVVVLFDENSAPAAVLRKANAVVRPPAGSHRSELTDQIQGIFRRFAA